MQNESEELRYF